MNNTTNNTATTTELTVTSAIYTNSEGMKFLIELDPTANYYWKYEVTFAGMKVIANEETIEKIIVQLDEQKSKYINQLNRLSEAGYKFDNSQTEDELNQNGVTHTH